MKTISRSTPSTGPQRSLGFTLTDLLAVLAAGAVGTLLLVPVSARSRQDARAFQCFNHNRELNRACRQAVDDRQDRLPFASPNSQMAGTEGDSWVTGALDYSPANRSNWDPTYDLSRSPLWPYCGREAALWRCPEDRSFVVVNDTPKPRVRSFAMNLFLGGWGGTDGGWGAAVNAYQIYLKFSDLVTPGPAGTWVFLDVREDSIDAGNYFTAMDGFPDQPALRRFRDLPGAYHDGGAGLSFADGHVERRRWRDVRTTPPLVVGAAITDHFDSPDNEDIGWLQERTTRPK